MHRFPCSFPKTALFVCLAILMARMCFAAAPTPPDPPLVGTPPDQYEWTIDVQQKQPRIPPPTDPKWLNSYKRALEIFPRLLRVKTEKSGKDLFEETLYEGGKIGVIYLYKDCVIFRRFDWPVDKALAFRADSSTSPARGGLGREFPDVAWIRPEVFLGTVIHDGVRCHHYLDKNAPPLVGGDHLSQTKANGVEAWIDEKSRLPVAVEDAAVVKKYSYRPFNGKVQPTGIFATAYEESLITTN